MIKKEGRSMKYWLVTEANNFPKMQKRGLEGVYRKVFLFKSRKNASVIAVHELGLTDYALFSVEIEKPWLTRDMVEGLNQKTQLPHDNPRNVYVLDKPIPKERMKFIGCYHVKIPKDYHSD